MDDMLQNRMNQCLIVQECKNLKNMEKVKSITDFMWAPQLLCSSPGTIELVKHWGTCLTKLYWLTSQFFEKSCKFKREKHIKESFRCCLCSSLLVYHHGAWFCFWYMIYYFSIHPVALNTVHVLTKYTGKPLRNGRSSLMFSAKHSGD